MLQEYNENLFRDAQLQPSFILQVMSVPSVAKWWARNLLHADRKKWVMFEHGSVVIFIDRPDSDNESLRDDAIQVMREDGPVMVACEHGDFSTISLDDGYVVTSHNPNLMTVAEGLMEGQSDLSVGLLLRSRRDQDSTELTIIAVSTEM